MIKPIKDRILIKPEASHTQTEGGIILTPNKVEKSEFAKVIAIGSTVKEVAVGDRIMYQRWASQDQEVGDDMAIIKEANVMMVM